MKNNLFVAISDVHISLKNLEVSEKVLIQALEKAKELNVDLVIAGDLNDTKAVMRSEWVQVLIDLFDRYDVFVHIIDGNHDLNNKASSSSSLSFLNLLDNVSVYHEPEEIDFLGIHFGLIPYQNTNEAFIEAVKNTHSKKVICHQGFKGAYMGDYVVDDSSVDPKVMEHCEIVLSGHYHRYQWIENIMYFGSPFTVNFGEAGHPKYIWVISEIDGEIQTEPVPTEVRKHVQFTIHPGYDPEQDYPKDIRDIDLVKIIRKGPKEFALGQSDYSIPSKNITVIPEIERQSEERVSQEIISKPKMVIEQYLEKAHTQFDKEMLKNFIFSIASDVFNRVSQFGRSNVRVKRAIGQNFLSFKSIDYVFDARGLTLVEGHDEDNDISTGAGKSSFFDLACYGLFGKTSKKIKADEVINWDEGKNAFVQVEVSTNKGLLIVRRYRKHKEYENDFYFMYEGQENAIRGDGNVETQKLLEQELGIDFDDFMRSTYFTQFGAIDQFLKDSDTKKKEAISKICETEVYDEIVEILKAYIKDEKKKLESFRTNIEVQEGIINTLKKSLDDNILEKNNFETKKAEKIEELKVKSKGWDEHHQLKVAQLYQSSKDFLADKEKRIGEVKGRVKDWEEKETLRQQSLIQKAKDLESEAMEMIENNKKPEEKDFAAERAKLENKIKLTDQLGQKLNEFDALIRRSNLAIQGHKKDIESVKLKKGTAKCLSCYQPISEEHIDRHIRELEVLIKNEEINIDTIRPQWSKIKQSVELKPKIQAELNKVVADEMSYQQILNSVVQTHKRAEGLLKSARGQMNVEPLVNPHLDAVSSIENETDIYLGMAQEKESEVNPFIERIEEEQSKINPFTDLIKNQEDNLHEKQSQLDVSYEEFEASQNELDVAEWWKDAIHVYIKSYLTDSFLDQVNVLSNESLKQMFDGILGIHISAVKKDKKKTQEKINVTIYKKNRECSYESLSGGERCRICLALNLAIRQISDLNLGFMMFDEVLNGLDEVGKSQAMKIFKELEAEYETVFVIDHTTEFKSLFTNSILIQKVNDISKLIV